MTMLAQQEIAAAFPAPALESVVRPVEPGQITHLRAALEQLAEQDPLISLRQRNEEGEISVRLYGEVQKEVVTGDAGAGLRHRRLRSGRAGRSASSGRSAPASTPRSSATDGNPFYATVGFRVEPARAGSGIRYERELGSLPLAFYRAIEETVHETLAQGLYGWEVTDCVVTLTHAGFWSPVSTAGDFRKLTPLVLMQALRQAGTEVCEPVEELELEIPEETFGAVCGALLATRARRSATRFATASSHRIICEIPTAELRAVEQQLPGLTRGDGAGSRASRGTCR